MNLKKSISAYQEALEIFTLKKYPDEYASTQSYLSNAYFLMSDIRNREDNLNNAIAANLEALKVFKINNSPGQYAKVNANMGAIYGNLAKVTEPAANLNKAQEFLNKSIKKILGEKGGSIY